MHQTSSEFTPRNCHLLSTATSGGPGPCSKGREKGGLSHQTPGGISLRVWLVPRWLEPKAVYLQDAPASLGEACGTASRPRAHSRLAPRVLWDSGLNEDWPEPLPLGLLNVGSRPMDLTCHRH